MVAVLIPRQYLRVLAKEVDGLHQEVIEVQRLALFKELLVALVDPHHHLIEVGILDIILGSDEAALG
ncbi:hypothetical protein ES703_109010 [subsurface metagenome]